MANKKNEFKTISINGVEYINKQQLAKKLGYSYFGLDLKLKKSSLKPIKKENGRVLFRLSEVIEAENRGEFIKYL